MSQSVALTHLPERRSILRERIQNGRDFDSIAQMVGWENITISSLHLPQHLPLIGKTFEEAAACSEAILRKSLVTGRKQLIFPAQLDIIETLIHRRNYHGC